MRTDRSNVLISCIVPVYNKGEYLIEFIDSIKRQTLTDFELIMVDDASEDNSVSIIKEQMSGDHRLRLIRFDFNKGAAFARNEGLNYAGGKYVIFLDADDICEPLMLEKACNICEKEQADMAVFNLNLFQDGERKMRPDGHRLRNRELIAEYPVLTEPQNFPLLFQAASSGPIDKVIKREMLERERLRFQSLPNCNDVYFSYLSFLCSKKIVFIDENLNNYRLGHNKSITANIKKKYYIDAIIEVYDYMVQNNVSEIARISFINAALANCYKYYSKEAAESQEIRRTTDFFSREEIWKIIDNHSYSRDKQLLRNHICHGTYGEEYSRIVVRENLPFLNAVLKAMKKKYKTIALWGYGYYGKAIMDYLAGSEYIDCIIDQNSRLQGTYAGETLICGYEQVRDKVDLILISSPKWADDIRNQVIGHSVLFNLILYLENNFLWDNIRLCNSIYEQGD